MTEPLLPTPSAGKHSPQRRKDFTPNLTFRLQERTSPSSQGSEDSTSPLNGPSDSDASDRSSTSQPALGSLSDGGRGFPDGEMSTGSMLLPTPLADDAKERPRRANDGQVYEPSEFYVLLTSSSAAIHASRSQPQDAAPEPMTRATSGLSSPVLLASYDPDGSCWRMFQATFPWGDTTYSETLPRSGMTRRGRLYALPMSAHRIGGSDGSASLPTPNANGATNGYPERVERPWVELGDRVSSLLHSPTASDKDGTPRYDHRAAQIVDELLPTPKTPTGGSERRAGRQARGSCGEDLEARLASLGDPTDQPSEDGSE